LRAVTKTKQQRVRINMVLTGEPAKWLLEWRARGLITSYTDAVIQALRVLHEQVMEQDLKSAQLGHIKQIDAEW